MWSRAVIKAINLNGTRKKAKAASERRKVK
jgi:hypothetical protein